MIKLIKNSILLVLLVSSFVFAQTGVELLLNNSFDDGVNEWFLAKGSGVEATLEIDTTSLMDGKNSGHIAITKQGSNAANWEIAVIQNVGGEGLKEGKKYYVKFQAKASEDATIDFWIKQQDSPWGMLYNSSKVLTTTPQTILDSFVVAADEPKSFFALAVGAMGTIDVWVDDIHVIEAEGDVTPPTMVDLLKNNYFDNALANWETWAAGGAEATITVDNTSQLEGENSAHIVLTKAGSSGESWELGFAQGIPEGVKAGKKYIVKYQARASESIIVEQQIQESNSPWGAIFRSELVLLNTDAQTFIDSFTIKESRECNWVFSFGALGSVEVWVDDIHFYEMDSTTTDILDDRNGELASAYRLEQNYPNPFNPATTVNFSLPQVTKANISIYNALGQKVLEVVNQELSAGFHSVNIDASSLSSGMYFYKLQTNNYSKTMKMLLLK